jgi:hypothetical protein
MKNCATYQRLLHLHREGERSAKETAALNRHLQTCAACAAVAEELRAAEATLAQLRSLRPSPMHAEELTTEILSSMEKRQGVAVIGNFESVLAGISSFMMKPLIRYACAAVIVLTIGLFSYEYYGLLRSMEDLEKQFASVSTAEAETTYVLPADQMTMLVPLDTLQMLTGVSEGQTGDGTLRITRSAITSLEDLYQNGRSFRASRSYHHQFSGNEIQELTARLARISAVTIQFDHNGV